jgi:light-regulated signal transduction histidine kinase (bacteriophytochrome)
MRTRVCGPYASAEDHAMHEMTGRETIPEDLDRSCADEPIHIIGTVQPHGFLLVVDVETARIVQVSSGVTRHWRAIGQASRPIGEPAAQWIVGFPDPPQTLLGALPRSDPVALRLQPSTLAPAGAAGVGTPAADGYECVGHRVGGLAVLEWQLLARRDDSGAAEHHGMVELTRALTGLRSGKALETFFEDCVSEVARLSGFDRVMLYRFLPDWTGEVIAEAAAGNLNTRFLGLRFPATDIPAQARALYADSKIRVLADVHAEPDTLVPPLLPGGEPLDQSHSLLRGFSEVHRSYLRNMGVRATMSLSIVCDGKLWGLVACHHYQPRIPPHNVRSALRAVCELVAEVSAMRIETLEQLAAAQAAVRLDKLLVDFHQAVLHEVDVETVLARMLLELLSMFQASALCIRVGSLNFVGGATQSAARAAEILHEIGGLFGPAPPLTAVLQLSQMLTPDSAALLTLPAAAGLLAVRQTEDADEFCAFVRPEVVQEVNWAGAPSKQVVVEDHGRVRLEPRRSFERWRQDIAGTARAWTPAEVGACTRLLRIISDASKRQLHKTLEHELRWRAHHDNSPASSTGGR